MPGPVVFLPRYGALQLLARWPSLAPSAVPEARVAEEPCRNVREVHTAFFRGSALSGASGPDIPRVGIRSNAGSRLPPRRAALGGSLSVVASAPHRLGECEYTRAHAA